MSYSRIITLFFLSFVIFTASVFAQAPLRFNYQAVLRDDAGQVMASEEVEVEISIIQADAEGTEVFSEIHETHTNEFGLVELQIGSVNSLENVDWSDDDYFIEVSVNGEPMGVSQLLSVPYALHSHTSDDAFSGNYDDLENTPDLDGFLQIEDPQIGDMLYYSEDGWQSIPSGVQGQVLTWSEGIPQWETPLTGAYTLQLVANPEGAGSLHGAGGYVPGQEVTISTSANIGYNFVNWTDEEDNVLSEETSFEYVMPDHDVVLTANFEVDESAGSVEDIDGNVYETRIIDGREWMAENLRTTRYNDGTDIPTGFDNDAWGSLTEGAYTIFPHNNEDGVYSDEDVVEAYGKLYNWYAVDDDRGLCPAGWRVATDADWSSLISYVQSAFDHIDDDNYATGLRSCRQVNSPLGGECSTEEHPRWASHGTYYGTDDLGFAALPGGRRMPIGLFSSHMTHIGFWWTSTQSGKEADGSEEGLRDDVDHPSAWRYSMLRSSGTSGRQAWSAPGGMSVRCVRDVENDD